MDIGIIGGGLTGMSAADTLSQQGQSCTLYEQSESLGGLAGSFKVGDVHLERFYHHLFTSDTAMVALIDRLGLADSLEWLPTSNSYFADRIYPFSTPLDLLRFSRLGLTDRLRLGLLYVRTTFVKDWHPLEAITAKDWLIQMAGERVYEAFWAPLLRSKFGGHADEVAAVWIWNKLKLRGSSRGRRQEERLGYLRGGFGRALDKWEERLREQDVRIEVGAPVQSIEVRDGLATGVKVQDRLREHDLILATTAPTLLADMVLDLPDGYRAQLRSIPYLANVCLVLQLSQSLSDTYWLNIGDPRIPFTGVIEHTNMQRPEVYGGRNLVYISRYLDPDEPLYQMSAEEILDSYLPHLGHIYPGFERSWVQRVWAWRDRYTQPLIGLHYSARRPGFRTPIKNLRLCSMAQVYPEDRGMNYAVAYGQLVASEIMSTP